MPCGGILLPHQGSNTRPLHWEHSLNHWTAREVSRNLLSASLLCLSSLRLWSINRNFLQWVTRSRGGSSHNPWNHTTKVMGSKWAGDCEVRLCGPGQSSWWGESPLSQVLPQSRSAVGWGTSAPHWLSLPWLFSNCATTFHFFQTISKFYFWFGKGWKHLDMCIYQHEPSLCVWPTLD